MTRQFSKAESLLFLKKRKNKLFSIPNFIFFKKKDFIKNEEKYYFKIKKIFGKKKIILRSSSISEDQLFKSNAGKFKSFNNIDVKDKIKILTKSKEIAKDFKNSNDQILIQEFIEKPKVSGVIFTRNISNNSPYCTINYDTSGKTNLITSGNYNPTMQTVSIFRDELAKFNFFGKRLKFIFDLEKIYKNNRLDIEFCIKNNNLFLFQCRPLKPMPKVDDILIRQTLINIKKKFIKLNHLIPNLSGKFNIFSNMCDWNPAEMIGNKPFPLAVSLYSELITDNIWSIQRSNYGYKNVRPNRLMVNLAGSPYIDVRTDFNSFLPKDLPQSLESKVINYYLLNLKKKPSNHDKVEFNIVETCYDFNTEKKLKKFLTNSETKIYINHLKKITNYIIDKKNNLLQKEINKLFILEKKLLNVKKSKLSELQKIYFIVDYCKKYGSLPFAGIARIAFIYTKLLKTLKENKYLTDNDYELFYESCETITNKMNLLLCKIKNNPKKKSLFLDKFGHLRPLTYSIVSKNYKENFKNYFSTKSEIKLKKKKYFKIKKKKLIKINKLLKKNRLNIDAETFFKQAKKSIELRELAKFIYSKAINAIFENLLSLAREIKISRSDLDYLSIKNLLNYYNNLNIQKLKKLLLEEIKQNKQDQKVMSFLQVPDFFSNIKDIYIKKDINSYGNYITGKNVEGKIINLHKTRKYKLLENKIVLLENADPGYDFIFSKKIKGLITCFGGANSHMSIRCLELEIPAIIGVGTKNYKSISESNFIQIDCKQNFYKLIN